jgi:predicted dehydrogenase
VIAVCDLDGARAKAVADEFGIKNTTPTVLHAPMSLAAIRAGKNVLCEKPFCLTLKEGQAVCMEAEERGVTLMVGESYILFRPGL